MRRMISCKVHAENARKYLNNIPNKIVPEAVKAALNRALQATRTQTVRDVSSLVGIQQKKARWRIRFQRRDEATTSNWTAKMFLVISDIAASAFGKPRQMKAGAKVKSMFFPGQFVAPMASGHTGIFRRTIFKSALPEAIRRQISYRGKMSTLPIEETKMEVRAQISENAWRDIRTVGMDTFLKRFNHEVARRLKV